MTLKTCTCLAEARQVPSRLAAAVLDVVGHLDHCLNESGQDYEET